MLCTSLFQVAVPLTLQEPATSTAAGAPALSVIIADLSKLRLPAGGVLAVRYGWPLSKGADTCCPALAVKAGTAPCIPGAPTRHVQAACPRHWVGVGPTAESCATANAMPGSCPLVTAVTGSLAHLFRHNSTIGHACCL